MNYVLLMLLGLVFGGLGTILFAVGWQQWDESRKMGSVQGEVAVEYMRHFPDRSDSPKDLEIALQDRITLRIRELDGVLVSEGPIRDDGTFYFGQLSPAQYLLDGAGFFVRCPERTVNILPGRDSDIGEITCHVDENASWIKRYGSPPKYSGAGLESVERKESLFAVLYTEKDVWLAGLEYGDSERGYFLQKARVDTNDWRPVYIPEASGSQRIDCLREFSNKNIIACALGKGALISGNDGESWSPLSFPEEISLVHEILELSNGTWLAVGDTGKERGVIWPGDESPQCLFFGSKDAGTTWSRWGEQKELVTTLTQHSSNRIVLGTSSVTGDGGIFVSEDDGMTWSQTEIRSDEPVLAVLDVVEMKSGTLLAAITTGRPAAWTKQKQSGTRKPRGQLFVSRDFGSTWDLLYEDPAWQEIQRVHAVDSSTLVLAAKAGGAIELWWSVDEGDSWFVFGRHFLGYDVRSIQQLSDKLVILSGHELWEAPMNRLVLNFLPRRGGGGTVR